MNCNPLLVRLINHCLTRLSTRSLNNSLQLFSALDPREASTLDCSLDESGIIVDESARREEKELKRRREAAKKELQKDIVKVQDEADLCLKQAHQLEV